MSRAKRRELGFILSVFVVPLASFLLFWVYVNASSLLLAFQTTAGDGTVTYGFNNFRVIFSQIKDGGVIGAALINTAIWFTSNVLIMPLQLLVTYFIFKQVKGYKFFRFVFLIPGLLPGAVYVTCYKYVLAQYGTYGYIADLLNKTALPLLTEYRYVLPSMLAYVWLTGIGSHGLVWGGAMKNAGYDVLEAARVDGANWLQELVHVLLPLIWPTLSIALMFMVAGILGASGPILVFTNGNYGTSTLSFWIFSQVQTGASYERPAALGLLMSAVSIPLVLTVRHFAAKVEMY
jgi:ABC-type sugar transport system permease subunit